MADLTAVTTTRLEKSLPDNSSEQRSRQDTDQPDDLEILQSKPSFSEFSQVIQRLSSDYIKADSKPSGAATRSRVTGVLVAVSLPTFWPALFDKSQGKSALHLALRRRLLMILSTTSGLGAVIAQIKALATASRDASVSVAETNAARARIYFEVLSSLLKGSDTLSSLLERMLPADKNSKASKDYLLLHWKELLSILCGGRLLSTTSEAWDVFKDTGLANVRSAYWIADPEQYTLWLADNVSNFIKAENEVSMFPKLLQDLLSRIVSMGRTGEKLLHSVVESECRIPSLAISLATPQVQRTLLVSFARVLSTALFRPTTRTYEPDWWRASKDLVDGNAYFYSQLGEKNLLLDTFSYILTDHSLTEVHGRVDAQRSILAFISESSEHITQVFERSLKDFGDRLYIKHTPILNQEVKAQVILLAAGHIHRWKPNILKKFVRSSIYLNTISNRLSASSEASRYLGMVVGEAISSLVDTAEARLKWDSDELKSSRMLWFKSLVLLDDRTQSNAIFNERLKESFTTAGRIRKGMLVSPEAHVITKEPLPETLKPYEILEPHESSSEAEDGLKPYAKPDSDPEDEDEDPTLVQRQKPVAPVYIGKLVKSLQETEKYDVQQLALSVAASLIRRKANFGTELRDDAEELAATLAGMKDNFEMKDFQEMRLQAMIALLVALPDQMGPWFSRTLFQGDYSVAQRSTVLATIGFASRELAGYGKEDSHLTKAKQEDNPFPSKRLPQRLHKIYTPQLTAMDKLISNLERTMIEPKALSAADTLSGPNMLKVRTFSSRMQVEKARRKPTPNTTSSVIATAMFFPLTSGWHSNLKAFGGRGVHFDPFLLTSFIKTISLVFHAAGPSSPYLKQMTTELWDLLLSLRTQSEITVLEAILFALLTLLETNELKRELAEEHSRELLETQEWASVLFDSASTASSGQDDENERLRMLTASVLLNTREIVQKYETMLVGQITGY